MSELTNQVRRMLSQAQKFVTDAPLEAVSRAELALATARAGLARASADERTELETQIELAETRLERYQQALSKWSGGVRARADLYNDNERKRLAEPLPTKV